MPLPVSFGPIRLSTINHQLPTPSVVHGSWPAVPAAPRHAHYLSSFVNFGVRPDLQFGTATDFSVGFWTKFTGTPGDLPFFANSYTSLSSEGYTISPSYGAGGIGWSLDDYRFESAQTINDGNWHHVLVSVKRAGQTVTSIDGQPIDTRIGTTTDLDTPLPTVIGQTGTFDYPEAGAFQNDDSGWGRHSARSLAGGTRGHGCAAPGTPGWSRWHATAPEIPQALHDRSL